MKKLFRNLMLVAAAALGMASCADVPPPFIEPGGGTAGSGTGGAWDAPFTVAELVANQTGEAVWVHGYIVGTIPADAESSKMQYMTFTADGASHTNLCIADSPDEKDYTKCVPVQLPSGSDARTMLNLKENPGKLGVEVWLKGTSETYCSSPGLKNVSKFTLVAPVEEDDKDAADTPAEGAKGDGSLENPFNAAAALNYTNALPADQTTTEKFYIKGIVCESSKMDISTQYKNATFHISDDGKATGAQFLIFRTKGLNGADIKSVDDVKVGDEVVVYASLVNYKGTTPETAQGGIIYSQKRDGVELNPGSQPGDPSGGGTWDAPYGVEDLIANQTGSEVWVRGYIVGSVPGSKFEDMVFGIGNASGTNLCIASSPTETDYTKCVPVQLPAGTDARTELNLKSNPDKLGVEVWLKGTSEKYCGAPGLKNVSKFTLSAPTDENGGTTGGGDNEPGEIVSCAQAAELCNALADGATSEETYTVTGYITEVVSSVSRNQQTFWMADTQDGGQVFQAYYANLPDGVTEFEVGSQVKITGKLLKYVNNSTGAVTPEIKNATVEIISEGDGNEGGETPDSPASDADFAFDAASVVSGQTGTVALGSNAYGKQSVTDASTWYTFAVGGCSWTGARICKATNEALGIQMQGNASDVAKQGFLFNTTPFSGIKKIVVTASTTSSYDPTFNLYVGNSEHPVGNALTGSSTSKTVGSAKVFTFTFNVSSGNYTHFTIANDLVGALYLNKVEVYTK